MSVVFIFLRIQRKNSKRLLDTRKWKLSSMEKDYFKIVQNLQLEDKDFTNLLKVLTNLMIFEKLNKS